MTLHEQYVPENHSKASLTFPQICIFYLVLRGLDTIEDDMTIPDDVKQPILRIFHEHTVTPGWNYTGCGPAEKDRQLLVEYAVVIEEVNRLAPGYSFLPPLNIIPSPTILPQL